jgi:hypothetical protein
VLQLQLQLQQLELELELKLFENSFNGNSLADLVYLEGYPYSTSGRS